MRWKRLRGPQRRFTAGEVDVEAAESVVYGDVVLVRALPQEIAGVRGRRRTELHREADGILLTEVETDWIRIRSTDGRPARVPAELLHAFRR